MYRTLTNLLDDYIETEQNVRLIPVPGTIPYNRKEENKKSLVLKIESAQDSIDSLLSRIEEIKHKI